MDQQKNTEIFHLHIFVFFGSTSFLYLLYLLDFNNSQGCKKFLIPPPPALGGDNDFKTNQEGFQKGRKEEKEEKRKKRSEKEGKKRKKEEKDEKMREKRQKDNKQRYSGQKNEFAVTILVFQIGHGKAFKIDGTICTPDSF